MILIKDKSVLFYILIILAILSRLLPHPANFTPIGALGLFAGAYLTRQSAWLIPIAAMLISDFFIGLYHPVAMLFVYFGFIASAVIGRLILFHQRSIINLAGSALASAIIFFILSNLGVWFSGTLYPMNLTGLSECYLMAIPFFGNTLISQFVYVLLLFGAAEIISDWISRRQGTHTA